MQIVKAVQHPSSVVVAMQYAIAQAFLSLADVIAPTRNGSGEVRTVYDYERPASVGKSITSTVAVSKRTRTIAWSRTFKTHGIGNRKAFLSDIDSQGLPSTELF